MEKEILLAELQKNCNAYRNEMNDLLKELELTILGNEIQEEEFKVIYEYVLSKNEFFATDDFKRGEKEIHKGERILEEEFTFLMSDDDFRRYQKLCVPYFVQENLTDERGYLITNWSRMVVDTKNKLFDFICHKVLPKELGNLFFEQRWNITVQNKVIDITKEAFAA